MVVSAVNSMDIDSKKILTVELRGNFSDRAASGQTDFSDDPIADYLDWALSAEIFGHAVLVPPKRKSKTGGFRSWPRVATSSSAARESLSDLKKFANAGFELAVGVNVKLDSAIQHFGTLGYKESGRTHLGSGSEHDPLSATWNKDGLKSAVSIALELSPDLICISAHDADPMYLLIQE